MSDDNRPYPDGVPWDEAWRQRQRAESLEAGCDSLARFMAIGCKISQQDGEWWLWEMRGDGIAKGNTIAEMLRNVVSVDVQAYEKRFDETVGRYMR
jgi:hypothetical protein